MSNRFVLIDREEISSSIEGVDFGGRCHVIARSPDAVLFWCGGHTWSVNGHQRYAEPVMVLLPDRVSAGNIKYRRLHEGGRLSKQTIEKCWPAIFPAFPFPESYPYFMDAMTRQKRTLIIDGGGPALMPSRYYGPAAYQRWRDLPESERGFYNRSASA